MNPRQDVSGLKEITKILTIQIEIRHVKKCKCIIYKVLCKLEGLLLNNSLVTVLHNECFPMEKDLNHLMICIVNLSRI